MAALTPVPKIQFFDANGNPLAGGKLYSYDAGTTTPRPTYTNYGGATPNANPVILDSRGEANVWLDSSLYKLKLTSATDVEIWTVDNVGGPDQATLAQLAASGGSALIGFLQAGTGAVTRTAQAKMRDVVSVKDFGAVGDGVTDDTAAIQAAIDYAAANSRSVFFASGTYKTSSTLTCDLSLGMQEWTFDHATIAPNFSGSEAVNISGSPNFLYVFGNMSLFPTAAHRTTPVTYANVDTTSHGIVVAGARLKCEGTISISSFKGYGMVFDITSGNSNGCVVKDAYIELCNYGVYCTGLVDDLSIVEFNAAITYCSKEGFYVASGCNVRQWKAFLKCEANCQTAGVAGVMLYAGEKGNWVIYSEQQNAALDIKFGTFSTGHVIHSLRANKDDIATGNTVLGPFGVYRSPVEAFTPVVFGTTSAGTATYSIQSGKAVIQGNSVHIQIRLAWTGHTGTGNMKISGLIPRLFVTEDINLACSVDGISGLVAGDVVEAFVDTGREIRLLKSSAGSAAFLPMTASGYIFINGSYMFL